MSSIPVIILGIRRKGSRARQTLSHLKKIGFKNVKIYYGLDIKTSNPENIKHNQIVLYNNQQYLKDFKGDQVIIAEDDVRITEPDKLFRHLKCGINGIDRLVWNRVDKGITQGAQMIGYDRSGIDRLLSLPLSAGHIDLAISRRFKEKKSGPFGIEYIYKDQKRDPKTGEIVGMNKDHRKTKKVEEASRRFDNPTKNSYNRYK